jgi:hypothetical protein
MRSIIRSLLALVFAGGLAAGCAGTAPTVTPAASPSAAPATPAAGTVDVTGSTMCSEIKDSVASGPPVADLPYSSTRGLTYQCSIDASDERLNGVGETIVDCDFSAEGDKTVGACSGTSFTDNELGGWDGTFSGTTTWSAGSPEHDHVMDVVFIGKGQLQGLRFIGTFTGGEYPWTIEGRIQPAS